MNKLEFLMKSIFGEKPEAEAKTEEQKATEELALEAIEKEFEEGSLRVSSFSTQIENQGSLGIFSRIKNLFSKESDNWTPYAEVEMAFGLSSSLSPEVAEVLNQLYSESNSTTEVVLSEVTRNLAGSTRGVKSLTIILELIECGYDVTSQNRLKDTLLHLILQSNANALQEEELADLFKLIAEKGANVNACNEAHLTPLHFAIENFSIDKHQTALKFLFEKADVVPESGKQYTPLHKAVKSKNLKMIQFLLDVGYDPKTEMPKQGDALALAILTDRRDKESIINELIKSGADIDKKVSGENYLHLAAKSSNPFTIRLLCERYEFDVNEQKELDFGNRSVADRAPIHFAAGEKKIENVIELIRLGANPFLTSISESRNFLGELLINQNVTSEDFERVFKELIANDWNIRELIEMQNVSEKNLIEVAEERSGPQRRNSEEKLEFLRKISQSMVKKA
ncbi:MAG: hypothetical protein ChlgKO_08960 [Chlamydiales bacterium]